MMMLPEFAEAPRAIGERSTCRSRAATSGPDDRSYIVDSEAEPVISARNVIHHKHRGCVAAPLHHLKFGVLNECHLLSLSHLVQIISRCLRVVKWPAS